MATFVQAPTSHTFYVITQLQLQGAEVANDLKCWVWSLVNTNGYKQQQIRDIWQEVVPFKGLTDLFMLFVTLFVKSYSANPFVTWLTCYRLG